MNKYEMMFIVKATMDAEQVKATAEGVKKNAESKNSKVVEYKELGEKKLAYPIKKELNGYYFVMQLESSKEAVAELDRKTALDENVLRHLIVKLDEE
jgi:small subunit ribosomal protein S6